MKTFRQPRRNTGKLRGANLKEIRRVLEEQTLTKADLAAYEAKRDLVAELLQSVKELKAGQVHVVSSPVAEARSAAGGIGTVLLLGE